MSCTKLVSYFSALEQKFETEGLTGGAAGLAGVSGAVTPPLDSVSTSIPPDDLFPVKEIKQQHESRLLTYLLSNYNKQVRPILDHNGNITVHVGITLTQIFDMVRNI